MTQNTFLKVLHKSDRTLAITFWWCIGPSVSWYTAIEVTTRGQRSGERPFSMSVLNLVLEFIPSWVKQHSRRERPFSMSVLNLVLVFIPSWVKQHSRRERPFSMSVLNLVLEFIPSWVKQHSRTGAKAPTHAALGLQNGVLTTAVIFSAVGSVSEIQPGKRHVVFIVWMMDFEMQMCIFRSRQHVSLLIVLKNILCRNWACNIWINEFYSKKENRFWLSDLKNAHMWNTHRHSCLYHFQEKMLHNATRIPALIWKSHTLMGE